MEAILSLDAQQRIIMFNPAAERMFGYAAGAVMGQPVDILLPERHRLRHRSHVDHFGATGVTGRAMGQPMTLEALRCDGEEFPIDVTISQFDVAGTRYYTAIVRDVTERVKNEERIAAAMRKQELLVREVHHRVKNNLQVIDGLLSLQAAAGDAVSARALLDAQTRVRAMSLVHHALNLSEDVAMVDFKEYLHTFIPELVRLHSGDLDNLRMIIEAENARFSVDVASPLALVVNELVTNALKYAFPDRRKGRIRVTARVPSCAGEPLVRVEDNGVGIPPEVVQGRSSFGLGLVATLAEQLSCRVEIDTTRGTRVSLLQESLH
jgi:PAS domain S-box-containing protein